MKQRIISGLIMVPFLLVVVLGGVFLKAAVFLIALVGMREFFNGFRAMGIRPSYGVAAFSVVVLYIMDLLMCFTRIIPVGMKPYLYILWLFLSVVLSMLYLFQIEKRSLEDGMATITGIVYIGFFSYHAVLVDEVFTVICGITPVWLILITAFCTDIGAYFGGYFLGKHKLCPVISPKKTVEGAVAGALASLLFCVLFAAAFLDRRLLFAYALMGLAGGIFSQFGDLTASIFKRKMGIKDYGKLIPGHGGIMDRFDSVLFTAPLVFYFMLFIYATRI